MIEKTVNFYLRENILKSNYEKFSKIGQVFYPLKTNRWRFNNQISHSIILELKNEK